MHSSMAQQISWPYATQITHAPQQLAGLFSLSDEQISHLSKGSPNCALEEMKVKINECIIDLYKTSHSILSISQSLLPALLKKQLPFWLHGMPLWSFKQSKIFLLHSYLKNMAFVLAWV